jgi:hypothetical protein
MSHSPDHRSAILLALAASAVLTALVIIGSRNLEHYDAALFGYTVASVVAFGAIVFRYAIWLQRPATRVYWTCGGDAGATRLAVDDQCGATLDTGG